MAELLHKDLSDKIIGAYYNIYNTLGFGFLEKVYENVYSVELKSLNLDFQTQKPIEAYYKSEKVGLFIADIVAEGKIILEHKAAENLCPEHEYQLLNDLKATNIEVGFIFNFGKKPQFKRLVFDNNRKKLLESF